MAKNLIVYPQIRPCPLILIGYFILFLGDRASSAAILPNLQPKAQRVTSSILRGMTSE
jgi:hypothetical protein